MNFLEVNLQINKVFNFVNGSKNFCVLWLRVGFYIIEMSRNSFFDAKVCWDLPKLSLH